MQKKIVAVSLFTLFFLATAALVAEIYVRATHKGSYLTGLMKRDAVFHHIPPPYYEGTMSSPGDFDIYFRTNNRGMRGPGDYNYEKPEGVFRIAVMGDSFTFGVGVDADKTASYLLGELLDNEEPGRYEVLNFGVNSYSPILEYAYLKNEVIRYDPDMVIVMLDISDIQDDYLYEPHIVYAPGGEVIACDPMRVRGKPDFKALCMKYSRLCYVMETKLFDSFRKMAVIGFRNYMANKFTGRRNKTEILTNRDIDNIYFDRFLMFREGKNEKVVARHWSRTAKYIKMIKGYLDGRGIRFILVTYPYGHQVGERQWQKGRAYWAFEPGKVYDAGKGFSVISDFAKENDIGFINLYGAMLAGKDSTLYFDSDGHWTEAGQAAAGRAIFDSNVFRKNLE
ncbi:MAG: SGNH/GDSL hydrolase family protein [Candidatus Omnitrophica bacterium]|nr:SGNH/GDSL hydrolase family protein [Candidatus Omnitrophota bacterium]